ncbi:MAG TPA: serine/threonine-protein kinase, partial [Minicystis sp.]|nr:serine/threonine-protein kinase [Minicystis sp.]
MAASLALGSTFARDYRVLGVLGQGGMGAVYLVEQTSTGARRALKLMLPHLASDADARRRFEREAKVGASIASDHVVQVLAAGVDDDTGAPYLVMELLEGASLDRRVAERGPLSIGEARALFAQLGHAMQAAHAALVVHRDLKPENLHVGEGRRAGERLTLKVLDFGIAKLILDAGVTATAPLGTLSWMAPEQAEERAPVTPATDVWSIGLVAFFALTGRPFWRSAASGSAAQLMKELLLDPVPSASARAAELGAPALPAGFDAWFAKAVARDPAERFQDGGEACRELVRCL